MSLRIFGNMGVSASGLRGQRARMDTIAENIANAETTRTAEGGPYRRKTVIMEQREPTEPLPIQRPQPASDFSALVRTQLAHMDLGALEAGAELPNGTELQVVQLEDGQPFKLIFNPGHPDADEQGYVLMPNVDVVREFVDLIAAQRAYEANVSAIESAKDMFLRALEI